MMAMDRQAAVSLAPGYRLQWEEAQRAHVLLYPEGMVTLNDSAGEILTRCDGRSVGALIDDLQRRFPGADLSGDVFDFLEVARDEGWIHCR